MGVISSRIRRHRRTRLAAEMACTWNPRRLFPLGQEQGGVYYPDDPNALLRRRNLLLRSEETNVSPWTFVNASGAATQTVNAYTFGASGVDRVTQQSAFPVSSGETLTAAVKLSGSGNIRLFMFDGNGSTTFSLAIALTGTPTWYQVQGAMTVSGTSNGIGIYNNGAGTAGASFTVAATMLARGAQTISDTTYQPVTTWNTEYMAAVGHLVTQFTDAAGTTAVQKVTDGVGLTLDRRFGLYRGPQLLTSGAIGLTGTATAATYSTTTGAGTVTRVDASNQSWVQFSGLTAGRSYQITVSGVSGGTLQVLDGSATGTVIASTTSATPCLVTTTGTTITLTASAAATVAFTVTQFQWLPGNHRIQAVSGSRKTLSARYNLLTSTAQLAWSAAFIGTGIAPVVTNNAGLSPRGTMTAQRVQLNRGAGNATTDASLVQHSIVGGTVGAKYQGGIHLKSNTGLPQTVMIYTNTGGDVSSSLVTVGNEWVFYKNPLHTATATTVGAMTIGSRGGTWASNNPYGGDTSLDLLVWGGDLRFGSDAASSIPQYQDVRSVSDFDTDGFPQFDVFDGTDDNDACATGGGNTSGLMLVSTITVVGGAGTNRVIWSDIGSNTGYRVRINTSNQLEVSAGNGSAFTTIATVATLPVGETHVISAWDDGVNLNVQIDNGTIASTPRPGVSAGTAGFTVGKENGASSGYFFGRIYDVVHRFSGYNGSEHTRLKQWAARLAGVNI